MKSLIDYMNNLTLAEIMKEVREKQCEVEIHITMEETDITVSPWEPFHYNCPYSVHSIRSE